MHRGYVNLWRRTTDSKFFSMGLKHIGLFSYLLLKSNWKTGWFMGEEIKPGQFATSITHLAESLHEHRHTVKKILQDLSDCSMITRQPKSNRWVLITICKWDSYQNPETYKNPTKVQPESNQSPTACHENATIKSSKALESGKDNTPPNPQRGNGYPPVFEKLWKFYPGGGSKKKAFESFKKSGIEAEEMAAAIQKQIDFRAKMKAAGEFVPSWANLVTWINGERWNDKVELALDPEASEKLRKQAVEYVASSRRLGISLANIKANITGELSEMVITECERLERQ